VKTPLYKNGPHRLFVLTNFGKDFGNDFAESFLNRFVDIIKACHVEADFSMQTPLDLDENVHAKRIWSFGPDAVLKIYRTGGDVDPNGNTISATYAVKLIDAKTDQFTWEAIVNFYRNPNEGSLSTRGEALAIELSNEMKSNKILGACESVSAKQ